MRQNTFEADHDDSRMQVIGDEVVIPDWHWRDHE